jgi:hypothetical protein
MALVMLSRHTAARRGDKPFGSKEGYARWGVAENIAAKDTNVCTLSGYESFSCEYLQ